MSTGTLGAVAWRRPFSPGNAPIFVRAKGQETVPWPSNSDRRIPTRGPRVRPYFFLLLSEYPGRAQTLTPLRTTLTSMRRLRRIGSGLLE